MDYKVERYFVWNISEAFTCLFWGFRCT